MSQKIYCATLYFSLNYTKHQLNKKEEITKRFGQ